MIGMIFIVSACFLWALDTLIRYPLVESGLSPVTIVFWEHVLLSLLFLIFNMKFLKSFYKRWKDLIGFIVIGCLGSALATVCFTKAFQTLNPSLVIVYQKFQPLFAILLASFVLKEKIKKDFVFWACLCLFGGILVSHQDFRNIMSTDLNSFFDFQSMGHLYVLISIIGWASSTVMSKWLVNQGRSNKDILTGRFVFGLMALIPFYIMENDIRFLSFSNMNKITVMVFISGAMAMYFYYKGLRVVSAKSCTLFETFFPFFAIIINWYFLNASLDYIQILGAFVLLVSSTVIQLKRY